MSVKRVKRGIRHANLIRIYVDKVVANMGAKRGGTGTNYSNPSLRTGEGVSQLVKEET